jgi:hypothetical protein
VLVVGPGNSGVDLLGHLARSDAGKLWLSARSGMNITPLRLGGVPLHPVSVLGRYLPLRWQDANARAVQWLAFGDLTRLGYPRSAAGAFTRAAADGVTVAVDDGFVRALKAGRVTMKSAIDRFDSPQVCFTDGTRCAPDAVICATGYRPGLEQIAGHLVALDALGMPPFTGACSSPAYPGLWFFGLDRSIYGNMHVRRRQARQLAQSIRHQPAGRGSAPATGASWPPGRPPSPLVPDPRGQEITVTAATAGQGQRAGLGILGPGHPARDVGRDQRANGRIPGEDGVCLGQRDQGGHGRGTGGGCIPLVILGHEHDLEPAVITVRPGHPVSVDDLHPPRLLACTWHGIQ